MSDLTRQMIDDIRPKGPAHDPAPDGDLDLLLEGMADNYEIVRAFVSTLSDIRDPKKTPVLSDLEAEYGIPTSTLLSEADRRLRLDEFAYGGDSDGTEDDLQDALRNAGFDVYVYQNDPAVDPAIFLDQQFQMVADGDNAYAGRSDAFAGRTGGELLVNGDVFKTSKVFTSVAATFYAGDGTGAGEYQELLVEKIEYPIPTDPGDWPLVYFVGGAATYGSAPNQSVNGDFETGDFTGWDANSATIDAVSPISGTYSAKLVAAGADLLGATTQNYTINSSKKYTINLIAEISSYVSGSFIVEFLYYDSSDNLMGTYEVGNLVSDGLVLFQYTIGYSGSGAQFTMPKGASKFKLRTRAESTPNFTARIDSFLFYLTDQVLTGIDNATVDGSREDEFKRTILKYGPMHSWAALIVNFA